MRTQLSILLACFLALLGCFAAPALGWSHQGHMIITRLAALRIINDPSAPQGLRDFLRQNMPHSLADIQSLALSETVGQFPATQPAFDQGLDHAVTMPDQIKLMPQARDKIQPYGAPEDQMHFCDLEIYSPVGAYRDDLTGRPDVDQIPHDLADPRWKRSGYVPWRVEEMYHKLIAAFGPGAAPADAQAALQIAGYLAHYVEDSGQPHHATVDFNSASYLVGHIKELPATTRPTSALIAALRLSRGIDPHGDLEFQLFAYSGEPLAGFRKQFWISLLDDINTLAKERQADKNRPSPGDFDPFRWDLHILSDSYGYLPLIGRAAQAAYASGKFDPAAFFAFSADGPAPRMRIIELISLQNARAVLNTEMVYRLTWDAAHIAHRP